MTVEELLAREAIRHTMAGYNMFGDRLKIADLVQLFAEDGVLELEGTRDTPGPRYEGREAIRQFFTSMMPSPKPDSAPPAAAPAAPKPGTKPFVRHHITTSRIELTGPDTAEARTYFAVYTLAGPDHCGYYLDNFKKVGDDWLFALRRPRVDWFSSDSHFRSRGE